MPLLTGSYCWNNKDWLVEELEAVVHFCPRHGYWTGNSMPSPRDVTRQQNRLPRNPARGSSPHTEASRHKKVMVSHTLWGVLRKSSRPRDEKQFTSAPNRWAPSPPPSYTPSRKRLTTSRSKLAPPKSSNTKIRSLDLIEVRILLVILNGDTLSRWLMCCNSPFTMTKVTHLSDSPKDKAWSPFSHLPPSPSPSSIWWKEKNMTWWRSKKRN